jgi:ribosomal protein L37AE/L43A
MNYELISETCPICRLKIIRQEHWACDKCEEELKPDEFNQFMVENFNKIFKEKT